MLTDKERRIVALKKEGKTVRDIAQLTNSSFTTIEIACKKAEEEEKIAKWEKCKQEEQNHARANYTQALDLFLQGKKNIEVAVFTGLTAEEVILIRKDYLKLIGADRLAFLYDNSEQYLISLLKLEKRMRHEGISPDDIILALKYSNELRFLKRDVFKARSELEVLDRELRSAQIALRLRSRKKRRLEDRVGDLEQQESHYIKKFQSYRDFLSIEHNLESLDDRNNQNESEAEVN